MKSDVWINSTFAGSRSFIRGSNARIIMGDDEAALLQPCWGKAGEAEPGDIPGGPRPSAGRICAAHADFVAALAGAPPRAIPLDVDAIDLEDRADHLNKVLSALSIYVTAILDDTAQNVSGGLDLGDVGGALSDLASDVTGTIQLAADAMAAGRIA